MFYCYCNNNKVIIIFIHFRIIPFASGENSIQHYNSLFSLAWLQKYSDITYYFPNDEMQSNLTSSNSNQLIKYSMKDINISISNNISGMFPYGNFK